MTQIPGVTQEMVDASVGSALDKLVPYEKELGTLMRTELAQLLQSDMPGDAMDVRFLAIVKRLGEIVGPVTACKKGCSHCCKMAVSISSKEAEKIGMFLGINPYPAKTDIETLDREKLVDQYCGTVCPFLKKNVCTIYEVRPYACRTHFNLSAYPEVCNVIDYPGNAVPNIDFTMIWRAQVAIYGLEVEYADIREFFPNGNEQSL